MPIWMVGWTARQFYRRHETSSSASTCRPVSLFRSRVCGGAEGQEAPSKDSRNVTVVTLYSESTPAPGSLAQDREPRRPPIQIVDGGVKSAGPSCWTLSDSGQITTVEGECYILRSAAAGEKPPAK